MMRRLLLPLFAFLCAFSAAPTRADHSKVRAELLSEVSSVEPGRPFWVGLRLTMEDGWHTYWSYPGDSGMPTRMEWSLPPGFTADEFEWPTPEPINTPPLVSYGYHGQVVLLVRVTPPAPIQGNAIRLAGTAKWLECADICVPGEQPLELSLPVSRGPADVNAENVEVFSGARARLPLASDEWHVRAYGEDGSIVMEVLPPDWFSSRPADIRFIPDGPGQIENASDQAVRPTGRGFKLYLERSSSGDAAGALSGVLVHPEGWRGPGSETGLAVSSDVGPGAAAAGGFWTALLFAFLGGLLLNVMPCVLPVLSIKVLGFLKQSDGRTGEALSHAGAFTGGVLASFWALAGALLLLRAGGREIGWGFQLQSPAFVALMAALFLLLGLNMMGVFEIGAGLTRAGGWSRGRGLVGSLLTGVLATIVATPCTAPFMGTALGVALAMPPLQSLLLFTSLGLGMALPAALLTAFPRWLSFVPKPGPWMETLKQAMGLLLIAACGWLAWVFALQSGAESLPRFFLALWLVGAGAWLLGRAQSAQGAFLRRFSAFAAAAVWLAAVAFAVPARKEAAGAAVALEWTPYSEGAVAGVVAEGRAAFVDFTAAWCLTCQVNERVALNHADVADAFHKKDVALFKADWTDRDPAITRALQKFGRNGVPVYALYPGGGAEPILLPSVLTPRTVLQALEPIRADLAVNQEER